MDSTASARSGLACPWASPNERRAELQALYADRSERFQTAAHLHEACKSWLKSKGTAAIHRVALDEADTISGGLPHFEGR
jgi:hypothetical protein